QFCALQYRDSHPWQDTTRPSLTATDLYKVQTPCYSPKAKARDKREEEDGSRTGAERGDGGDRAGVSPARHGHRVPRGADRAPDPPHRVPDGALQDAPQGSPLPPRVAEARRSASATARLPPDARVP